MKNTGYATCPPRSVWAPQQAGIHPLLAQLYAARGVHGPDELTTDWPGCCRRRRSREPTAVLLADAMVAARKICVVARLRL
jgi:single-stranded-DNA-specific exonuclease